MSSAPSAPPASPPAAASAVVEVKRAILRPVLQIGLIFSPVVNILVLTSSLYMMQVFDRVMTSQSMDTLVFLTIIALAATALMAALELVRSRIMTRLGLWLETRLAAEAIDRAVEATLLGREYRTEVLRDLAALRNFFTNPATLNLFDVPWVPVYLIVVALLNWKLGALALVGALLLGGLAWLNDRVTSEAVKESGVKGQRNFKQAEAAIRNAEVLDVMGMTGGLVRRWRIDSDAAHQASLHAADRSGDVVAFSKFARLALQLLVMALGAHLALSRELSSGGMIASSIIISRALAPIEAAIGSWKYTLSSWQAFQRIRDTYARPLLRASSMRLPKPKGHLSVELVSFVPPGSKFPVVKGVSFEIKPGQITALVGPSAAGKSTLARLCVGAYPPAYGNVRLDGADVFLWNRDDFSPHVGYLPQDVELFSGTIRDNISRLMPSDPAEVVQAAQMAGAHDMILRLPQGYETEIGEGGVLLSGGQRQRIALARALFRNPQLIVLDEPNSSLDSEGEEALNRAIAGMKQRGATVLLIGHRPSILQHVDTIIVMRDGRIELMGPKADILAKIMPQPMKTTAAPDPQAIKKQ